MNVYVSLWRITCALFMKNFNENRKITHKRKHVTREKTVKYPRQNTYIHIHTHIHEWESGKRDLIEQFKMLLTLRYLNIQTNFHLARSSLTLRPFYARKQIFIPPYVFFKKFLKTNIHRVPLGVSIRRVVSLSLVFLVHYRAEKHVFVFSNPGTDPGERAGRETRVVSA